ncbi:PLP-dependent aminotransferase family protein [Paenibacillus sp. UNC499MF]|uniref:aminotransferase-like domain-containing protein n=1 Tax=Paenibacillus sp. UNC499MF TaxID=1502751 RepID=UPI0008A00273|nr:PLP-dependent aminotransferase family protein [Paenibacillus sp. UNC499MF]SEG28510.1 GntR family transcriptional regulator, regulator for abcA and norABC [Paenibacillus sp. UNC499MF]
MQDSSWKPDRASSIPLSLQIKQYIISKIENGEWPVGVKIPPQRTMAAVFEVNRSTVVAAIDELIADGILEGRSGSGTRVVNNSWTLLAPAAAPDWPSYVQSGVHRPNRAMVREINRAEFTPGIIRLGTGELSPDLHPHEMTRKVLERLPGRMTSLGYEEPKGLLPLREKVSAYLGTSGIQASPSSILIVSGALQALQLISLGLSPPGSTLLLEKPSYLFSLHMFQSAGVRLCGLPMDERGIMADRIPELAKRTKGAMLYTIPSFHNPTGTLMPEERRKELLDACEKAQLPVIEDDVYRELWLDEPPPPPLKAMDRSGLVLHLGSLSKTWSPGLRIGWVVGPEAVIDRLADLKMQTDYGSSSLSQWAAAELLSGGLYAPHLETVRTEMRKRRNRTLELLDSGFKDIASWEVPSGGFYIWLKLTPSLSMRELFEKGLQEGILLNPGSLYDPLPGPYLRISYSYASFEDLEKGLLKLSVLIRRLAR